MNEALLQQIAPQNQEDQDFMEVGQKIFDQILEEGPLETVEDCRRAIDTAEMYIMAGATARVLVTERLSHIKATDSGASPIDLTRENKVRQRAERRARILGLDPRRVVGLFGALIDKACEQHNTARAALRSTKTE